MNLEYGFYRKFVFIFYNNILENEDFSIGVDDSDEEYLNGGVKGEEEGDDGDDDDIDDIVDEWKGDNLDIYF